MFEHSSLNSWLGVKNKDLFREHVGACYESTQQVNDLLNHITWNSITRGKSNVMHNNAMIIRIKNMIKQVKREKSLVGNGITCNAS